MRIAGNRFLVIGRAGMDLYADPPGTRLEEAAAFTACLGGSAGNIAAGLARQGGAVAMLTRVSDDAVGRFCRNRLAAHGIETTHVATEGGEARTSLAIVETRLHDCQNVLYRNGAADFGLGAEDVAGVDFARFDAVIVTGTVFAAEPSRSAGFAALAAARAAGAALVIDLDYRPYSWPSAGEAARVMAAAAAACDIIVGNDVEFDVLAGRPGGGLAEARRLAASGAAIVVHKMGERGAITLADGAEIRTGIYPVEALKPTGAGDAFMAGLIAALAGGAAVETAVLRGSACAAIVVSRVGCAPAMPGRAELDSFLAGHPGPSAPRDN
ncbi:5-dehydro-2-deoxygluconokinase [Albidovulum sp.]